MRVIHLVCFLSLLLLNSTLYSKDIEDEKGVYSCSILFTLIPLSVSGLQDVHVSDWQLYGTGVMEGRAQVDLSQSNTDHSMAKGAAIEIGYRIGKLFSSMIEIPFVFNKKAFALGLHYGLNYDFLHNNRFRLGIVPKGGIRFVSLSGAKVVMLPNKTPPIITENYTFFKGDPVSGGTTGGTFSIALQSEMRISKKHIFTLSLGFQNSIYNSPKIWIGQKDRSKEFKISDPEIIKPMNNSNGTIANADFTGRVKGKGLFLLLGLKMLQFKPKDEEDEFID